MLHITNGDCAAAILRAAGMQGDILPWRDVLHEGPVDARLPQERLSDLRAAFIASAGWGELSAVRREFAVRDARLQRSASEDEVVLWFEHDLYDQLQLAQLLAWFNEHPCSNLTLVCEAEYLGTMQPSRAATLFAARRRVSRAQLRYGSDAWLAFGSDDPSRIDIRTQPELPFLGASLRRHLEEFPWLGDDLSRLEREVIQAVEAKALAFPALFKALQTVEEPVFLGDAVLQWRLERMEDDGLVSREGEAWRFASKKRTRRTPRWLGGACVDASCRWRWDPARAKCYSVPDPD